MENDGDNMFGLNQLEIKKKQTIIVFANSTASKRKWVENDEVELKQKRGVFACNMGLGLFKRVQIIYDCVIIITIILKSYIQ